MRRARSSLFAAALLGLLAGAGTAGEAREPGRHFPLSTARLEQLLPTAPFEILEVRGGVGGVMGVKKLRIHFPELGREIPVKWKPAPRGRADGWNNTPRKELAAYEIQKWFLDPADYVVPTTVVRCVPFDVLRPVTAEPKPTLRGTGCVVGTLVIWLEDVTVPDELYDEERFHDDRRYARHLADFNLLTYLIDHEDGRRGNFLVSEDDGDRRVFSIDNGVAFGARVTNWFVRNWDKIRVDALPKQAVERLRRVGEKQLAALGVLAELRADEDGILRPVTPGENLDPKRGSRVRDGVLQLGLSRGEIDDVRERLEKLLAGVDAGRWKTF